MPIMEFYKIPATATMYNTKAEIDILMQGIKGLIEVFG